MNRKMISFTLGRVLLVEAALMVPAVICGIIYGEQEINAFFIPIVFSAVLGLIISRKKPENTVIYAREGFFIVAMSWVILSLIGSLPLFLCGKGIPIWDSIFETVSGFTTTGATVITNVEALPHCILFWRSFTHWIGGMGVLVFVLAIVPMAGDRSLHIMRAEVPGPTVGKLVPKMHETAKILYGVYSILTAVLVILLLAGGMPLFDSLCHAFGTAGTGGFSIKNSGIMFYDSAYIETVLGIFMLIFGINFNLFYLIMIKKVKAAFKSEELRWYFAIIAASVVLIAINTLNVYGSFAKAALPSFFQVASIISTTGYATADFANNWPQFAQCILLVLMFIGGCAGSTSGGLKVSRFIILIKTFASEIKRMLHPKMVPVIRMDGKALTDEIIQGTRGYFALYVLIIILSTLLLSLDNFDFTTNFSAEVSCFNNIGPGLGLVGPIDSFSIYSPFSKMLLAFNMLLGRLEIFPILIMFSPSIWKKSS